MCLVLLQHDAGTGQGRAGCQPVSQSIASVDEVHARSWTSRLFAAASLIRVTFSSGTKDATVCAEQLLEGIERLAPQGAAGASLASGWARRHPNADAKNATGRCGRVALGVWRRGWDSNPR